MNSVVIPPTINRLKFRMDKETNKCLTTLEFGNLICLALKKEQISQRYLRLMQAAMRRE